jgi:hypothetical protein
MNELDPKTSFWCACTAWRPNDGWFKRRPDSCKQAVLSTQMNTPLLLPSNFQLFAYLVFIIMVTIIIRSPCDFACSSLG